MKAELRGRSLEVGLGGGAQEAAAQLQQRGFPEQRADDVAQAAIKYAEEETGKLVRLLTPRSAWPGTVVLRRHFMERKDDSWLLLRYEDEKRGWKLDSAFFP